jgi:hypothetical protein
MRRWILLIVTIVGGGTLFAWPDRQEAERPAPTYVGAARCKVCHLEVYNSWEKTSHAKAFVALKEDEAKSPACLRCHVTGYADSTYGIRSTTIDLKGVQCEACHGPGTLYAKSSVMRDIKTAHQLGLVLIDSLRCARCHNQESPTFKGFSYRAGLSSGTHLRKPGRGRAATP